MAGDEQPRSPHWSRTAYDRYVEWAQETGTTPNGVFGAKLMWGYFGDFVSLLRNVPDYRDLPLAELLPAVFPGAAVRARRPGEQGPPGSLSLEGRADGYLAPGRGRRPPNNGSPPYQSFVEQHRPNLRFHYGAISHLLEQVMRDEAAWDAFFEHTRIKPTLVLYENFASDYEESTLNLLDRLGARTA